MDIRKIISIFLRVNFFSRNNTIKKVFSKVYKQKTWGDIETISGPGSTLKETTVIRKVLPELLKQFDITSFLDAPCGDFNWIQQVDFGNCVYIGVDIVESMIEANKKKRS